MTLNVNLWLWNLWNKQSPPCPPSGLFQVRTKIDVKSPNNLTTTLNFSSIESEWKLVVLHIGTKCMGSCSSCLKHCVPDEINENSPSAMIGALERSFQSLFWGAASPSQTPNCSSHEDTIQFNSTAEDIIQKITLLNQHWSETVWATNARYNINEERIYRWSRFFWSAGFCLMITCSAVSAVELLLSRPSVEVGTWAHGDTDNNYWIIYSTKICSYFKVVQILTYVMIPYLWSKCVFNFLCPR